MADPTVPWGIPTFDDNDPFAPVQAPLNAQSEALNDALSDGAFAPYATKALMDAAPGTRVGQHATVYADGTDSSNGDYRWDSGKWGLILDDTGWITPNLAGGWTNEPGNPIQYRRKNGFVWNRGRATTSGANATMFTYGTGFLPDFPSSGFNTFTIDASSPARVSITSAGDFVLLTTGVLNSVSPAMIQFIAA